ncbi:MAG: hypothetical protein K2P09_00800 [Erysipelotrichales bacterium]|nr:hypothetical protein [Erysipelotrichales bacterium]
MNINREAKRFIYNIIMLMMICLSIIAVFKIDVFAFDWSEEPYVGLAKPGSKVIFVKEWDDDGDLSKRPKEIKFTADLVLAAEIGNPTGTTTRKEENVPITLKADNNWTYECPRMYKDMYCVAYWKNSIKELEVDGYRYAGETVTYQELYGDDFVIVKLKNTKQEVKVTSTQLGINGVKILNGRHFENGDKFKFEIKNSVNAPEGQPLPDKNICEINPTSGNKANITFGDFTFTKLGEYIYIISEYLPQQGSTEIVPNLAYDTTAYRLTIDVKSNEQTKKLGVNSVKIEKSLHQENGPWTQLYKGPLNPNKQYCDFTNIYSEPEQTISLMGTKVLKNKKLADYGNKQFKFIIEAVGKKTTNNKYEKDSVQPMPRGSVDGIYIFKNLITGDIVLPNITFTKDHAGNEYRYILRELQPTKDGTLNGEALEGAYKINSVTGEKTKALVSADGNVKWVYKGVIFDNHVHIIDVKVDLIPSINNKEEVKVSISHDEQDSETGLMKNFVFTNEYKASTILDIQGTKTLEGREFKKGDNFIFNVTPIDNAPKPVNASGNEVTQIKINPVSGNSITIDFGTLKFDISNMDGKKEKIFKYRMTESNGKETGMVYDTKERIVKIKVIDDGFGNMTAKMISNPNDLTWNNKYNTIYENVEDNKTNQKQDFTDKKVKTGDETFPLVWVLVMGISCFGLISILAISNKKKRKL